jgi:hypothetical protein
MIDSPFLNPRRKRFTRAEIQAWIRAMKLLDPQPSGKRLSKRKGDEQEHYYRAIPFRHSVPQSEGTVAPRMGSAYAPKLGAATAQGIGALVYGKAKKLKATTSLPGAGVSYGGRLMFSDSEQEQVPKLKPHHAGDIYSGMIRQRKTYEKATQSQYTTFRVISTRVPDKWHRPSKPGAFLSDRVGDFVTKLAPKSFQAYLASLQP